MKTFREFTANEDYEPGDVKPDKPKIVGEPKGPVGIPKGSVGVAKTPRRYGVVSDHSFKPSV